MSDRIALLINGAKIQNFLSYRVEADIYRADHAFSLELARPETEIKAGQRCELRVNDELALTGIIDKVSRRYQKSGLSLQVEGRDLMGLLVDSHCEKFVTVKGKKLSELAEMLLETVPFINRKNIIYQQDVVGSLGNLEQERHPDQTLELYDKPHKFTQISPGMTVFEVLKTYALSRGLMFFSLPDGTFVFGRPRAKGEPAYNLVCTREGEDNNILEGSCDEDISKRYSKVRVIGQQQGRDDMGTGADGAGKINTAATATDPDFPFYKPYVSTDNNDSDSPAGRARLILEKQRHEGFQLNYKVRGHTQGARVWTINELVRVKDDVLGQDKVFLVFGRTFELSRQGVYTSVKLGPPGLVA